MNHFRSKFEINGTTHYFNLISIKDEVESVTVKEFMRLHHILILDRSGSMSYNLSRLIEQVKLVVKSIHEDDLITVMWFSGSGEFGTLFKGMKSRDYDDICKLLDSINHTVGLTCFSDILKEMNSVIDEFSALCSDSNVLLFTDGHPVTSWSRNEEVNLIITALTDMRCQNKVVAFNTIGYGHYDENLLKQMTEFSDYGISVHSDKIEDYPEIFSRTKESIEELTHGRLNLTVGVGCEILYLDDKNSIYRNLNKTNEHDFKLSRLSKKKNHVVIISTNPQIDYYINDVENHLTDEITSQIPARSIPVIMYAYAYQLYKSTQGDSYKALRVLADVLKDKNLIDAHYSAFTVSERYTYSEMIRKAINSNKHRHQDSAPEGYIPAEDAFCLFDLLKILADNNSQYIPTSDYKRIGRKVEDKYNVFEGNWDGVRGDFSNLIQNKEFLNLSVRYQIPGVAHLNPRAAEIKGVLAEFPCYIYRAQTLIKDGYPNMDEIFVEVNDEVIKVLNEKDIYFNRVEMQNDKGNGLEGIWNPVRIDLTQIPMINRKFKTEASDLDAIHSMVTELQHIKGKIKILKYFLGIHSNTKPAAEVKVSDQVSLNKDQLDWLMESYNIDSSLCYRGVDNKINYDKEKTDTYISRNISFELAGWSGLSSLKISEFIDEINQNKSFKGFKAVMADFIKYYQEAIDVEKLAGRRYHLYSNIESWMNKLEITEKQLANNLYFLRVTKIITGDWWNELEPDKKGNYNYQDLVIKAKDKEVAYTID